MLRVSSRGPEVSVWRHALARRGGGRMLRGRLLKSHSADARDSTVIRPMVACQPYTPPIHAPSGVPSTEATDQPRNTKVMPRPRRCAGRRRPRQDAAGGEKVAAERTART